MFQEDGLCFCAGFVVEARLFCACVKETRKERRHYCSLCLPLRHLLDIGVCDLGE